jgi:ankyrin repeat protein
MMVIKIKKNMKKIILGIFTILLLSSFQEESRKWDYDKRNWSPLMIAIYYGEVEEYPNLIKRCKDLTYIATSKVNTWRLNALEVAIRRNDETAVKLLIESKKFPNLDEYLYIACSQVNPKTISILLDSGANENYTTFGDAEFTPLIAATNQGDIDVLDELLKKRPTIINYQTQGGRTALMFACHNLDYYKVKLLLKYGANPNLKDYKGRTALDYVKEAYYPRVEDKEVTRKQLEELLLKAE